MKNPRPAGRGFYLAHESTASRPFLYHQFNRRSRGADERQSVWSDLGRRGAERAEPDFSLGRQFASAQNQDRCQLPGPDALDALRTPGIIDGLKLNDQTVSISDRLPHFERYCLSEFDLSSAARREVDQHLITCQIRTRRRTSGGEQQKRQDDQCRRYGKPFFPKPRR